ncbi:hypothetical protein [Wolbachia endosymbiont (group A) of Dendrolimus pini]|uniref:TomO hydrophobic C-terminal domain-containing protein n=1 Tax=Wolbachia endosymbiont (group A) of Dendrolimus pini TaxID=3066171 RepID=UPI003132CEB3
MQFNSGGIGKDSLTYQNVKNLSLKENSIRNPKKTGKENSESAAISVARVGASVEEKTAARSCPYARKTKTRIENLPPKRNSIRNLDLNRIGKENSESAAISVARIDANAEKKTTARNHLCRKRAGTQVEEDLVFPKKVKTLLFRVEGSNSIIGNQNELKVRQVEAELDKASNLLEEKQSSFDSQAVQPEESKTKIEEAQKEISDERDQLERELEGSSNAAIELNNKVKETLDERDQLERELEGSSNAAIELNNKVKETLDERDQLERELEGSSNAAIELNNKVKETLDERDQLERELEGSSNAAIELNNKVKELEEKNDQVNELNEKVFSIETERNTLKDQITKIQNELARKESEIGRLNDQLSKSYQHIEQLKQDKNKKEEELLDQQNKVKELNDKVNSITNERNCLNGQIETQLLEKNIEAYVEEQLARKESEIGRLNDQLSKSYQHIEQLKQDKNKKEEELLDQQNKVKELNDKVNSITNERNCLNGQIETQLLEKNIEAYVEEQLARKESEIGRLNDQLSKSYQHIEQLKQDKNKKEEELLDQQNKVKELNDKVNSITNERNCLNGQIETQLLEKNIEAYVEEQLARKESEIGRLNDQLSKSYQHIEQLKQDKNKKEEELLDQQNKVKELNDKVNSITNERNCLNGQIETQLLEKNKEFDEFKKERDTLTNQVQEKKNELSAKEEAFSKVQTNAQDLTYEVNQKDQQLEQVVREKQRLEAKFRGLNEKYSEVKNKDRGYIENLTCKLRQAKSEFIDNENKLSDQIEKLKEEKEILLEQLRAKSTGSASFRKQQSKIDSLKQQIKQKEEPKSVRNLEQLQNISGQNKIETTVPENSAESELNSTRLTEFEGNNIHVQASAAPAATVTSMNVKNIEKVPVMLETPSDKSGSQKLVSVQQEMSSVANESSGQVNGSQTNGMQPNNSSNGSIIVTQSVQKNKWPTTATWKLAIAGVLAGIAASVAYFTFSASLLVTGVIAGVGACCLVAAAIVYYCNKPSSSLEKSSIDKVAVNGYTAAASCE